MYKNTEMLSKITKGVLLSVLVCLSACISQSDIEVLVITGGHEYDRKNFVKMFESFDGVGFTEAFLPEANEIYLSDSLDQYDVIVYYDMFQEISDEQKEAFLKMLHKGTGIVFLHHSIASYQDWDEFATIRGGRYDLDTSTYFHDQELLIHIVNAKHRITRGIEDFTIRDETYDLYSVNANVQPLILTEHTKSEHILGWTKRYAKSRIVYLQPGHDNNAYSNSNYRKLVQQSIEWANNN